MMPSSDAHNMRQLKAISLNLIISHRKGMKKSTWMNIRLAIPRHRKAK